LNHYIRLSYASRSVADHHELRVHLGELVTQSQLNNPKHHIVGVLCYSNGFFFQCVEGPIAEVDILYQKLLLDPRHHDVRLLGREDIQQPYFSEWSMKYITLDQDIQAFLKRYRLYPFQPYQLQLQTLNQFLLHLAQLSDPSVRSGHTSSTARRAYQPHPHALPDPHTANGWIALGGIVALIAGTVLVMSFYFSG
jgi:hypothetical protein